MLKLRLINVELNFCPRQFSSLNKNLFCTKVNIKQTKFMTLKEKSILQNTFFGTCHCKAL